MSGHIISGFTPLIDDLVQELGLFPAAIYGRIWRYAQGKNGVCVATLDNIASSIGVSVRTVIRYIKVLIDAGYIEDLTPKRRYHPHRYRLTRKAQLRFETRAIITPRADAAICDRGGGVDDGEFLPEVFIADEEDVLETDDSAQAAEYDDLLSEEDPFVIGPEDNSDCVSFSMEADHPQDARESYNIDSLARKNARRSNKETIDDTTKEKAAAASRARARAGPPESQNGVGELLARAGIFVGGVIQAEMWQDLYETAGKDLFRAALEEAIRSRAGPPTVRYVEAIVRRCLAEGRFPNGAGNPGAAREARPTDARKPVRIRWRNPITGEIGEDI